MLQSFIHSKRKFSRTGSQLRPPAYRRRAPYGGKRRKSGGTSYSSGLSIVKSRYKKSLTWNGPGLLPQQLWLMPKYQYWYTFTEAAGFYDWVIKGNGLYDPDVAIGGDSFGGLAEMSALYTRYNVSSSRVRIRAVNNDSDDPVDITIFPSKTSAAFSQANGNAIRGYPLSKFVVVSNQHGHGEITHSATTKDVCGIKDNSDEGFVSALTADPTHLWYWHICINNHQPADHALNVQVWLEVEAKTCFSNFYAWTQ